MTLFFFSCLAVICWSMAAEHKAIFGRTPHVEYLASVEPSTEVIKVEAWSAQELEWFRNAKRVAL